MTARGHSPFGRRGARLPTPAAAIRRPRDPSTTPVARRRRRSVGMRTPTPRHHRWVSHSGRRSGRTNGPRQIGQWSPQISRDSRPCLRGGDRLERRRCSPCCMPMTRLFFCFEGCPRTRQCIVRPSPPPPPPYVHRPLAAVARACCTMSTEYPCVCWIAVSTRSFFFSLFRNR